MADMDVKGLAQKLVELVVPAVPTAKAALELAKDFQGLSRGQVGAALGEGITVAANNFKDNVKQATQDAKEFLVGEVKGQTTTLVAKK